LEGNTEITCRIDRKFWKKTIATTVLKKNSTYRKCKTYIRASRLWKVRLAESFRKIWLYEKLYRQGFSNARQNKIEEIIYKLD